MIGGQYQKKTKTTDLMPVFLNISIALIGSYTRKITEKSLTP